MKEAGFDNILTFRPISMVKKRDGTLVAYDLNKIATAVQKAMSAVEEGSTQDAYFVARNVQSAFQRASMLVQADTVLTVESVQDAIERELMLHGYTRTAKAFILYRQERAALRAAEAEVPSEVKLMVANSKGYFRNPLAEFVYYRTYSRWREDDKRRETWIETVGRYMDFMQENLGGRLTEAEYSEVSNAILNMEVMPSMRLMWSAGDAARKTNVAAFNCAYIAPDCLGDFGDIMYILACGTGVGFSVEARNVQQFPVVKRQAGMVTSKMVIEDSKEGWAEAFIYGMSEWFGGMDVEFDYSLLRPEGARLKTMGGRSSGPEPLKELMRFTRTLTLKRQGRRLTQLDIHDIICKIGDAIVVGGVRRSALISLSDLDDVEMRGSKSGHFWLANGQRQLANNSAVYDEKPTAELFLREWMALVESHTGERGIFNRGDLPKQMPKRRMVKWNEMGHASATRVLSQPGTNPCGEITLLSKQFCNLTEVVCRANDLPGDLFRKVRVAAILGTYQATLTNYSFISEEWKKNCDEERLLGVSLTGQWDCVKARDEIVLGGLREAVIEANRQYARRFGIAESTSVTCVKPSGTVSQLVDASSGMHARFAPFYIRRVRISNHDPLFAMLKDFKIPFNPEVGQTFDSASTFVFDFPVRAPEGSVYQKDISALQQLEHWLLVKKNFTEHNPSVTVSVGEDEWVDVAHWVWSHWEMVGGLSFLPREDHIYKLAPYEAITEERYEELCKLFEGVDYSRIVTYEKEDNTEGSKELACVAGVCEI